MTTRAGTRGRTASVAGLARACHPAPTATVTAAVTLLAAAGGRDAAGCGLVLLAVLTGQLSVGWSNDALDAARDTAVGRVAKPVVAGLVSRRVLAVAAGTALAVSAVLSFAAAGPAGGACHLLFLASAWAYNLGLKSTRWSLVPYAVGFGALPGFVTFGLDPSRAPHAWSVAAAALLGVAAGLANAAPDVEDDTATGVRGAVGRLGARRSRVLCVLTVLVATVLVVAGAGLPVAAAVGVVVAAVVLGAIGLRVRDGALLFGIVLVLALVDVVLLAVAASSGL